MFCPKCGSTLEDGVKFCTNCGYRVPEGRAETSPANEASQPAPAPHISAPDPKPAAADKPTVKQKKSIKVAVVVAVVAAVVAVGAAVVAVTGVFSGKATYSFGSSEAVAVASTTPIVPSSSADSPLTHYYVRVKEAVAADGSVIDVLGWPRLEVSSDEGFCLADFTDDGAGLADGTYSAVVTADDGADQELPPLAVGEAASGAADSSGDGSASGSEEAASEPVIVVPASGVGSTDDAQTTKQGRYAAFLGVLNDLGETYGEPGVLVEQASYGTYWLSAAQGLCYAQLVNFGDGEPRMLVAYCTVGSQTVAGVTANGYEDSYKVEVYEYDAESDSAQSVFATTDFWTNGATFTMNACFGADGTPYLYTSDPDGLELVFYGATEDGAFGTLAARTVSWDESSNQWALETEGSEAAISAYESDSRHVALFYSGATEDAARGLEPNVQTDYLCYGPEYAVSQLNDLASKLTCATTNSGDAPTKLVGGDADGDQASSGAETAADTTQQVEEIQKIRADTAAIYDFLICALHYWDFSDGEERYYSEGYQATRDASLLLAYVDPDSELYASLADGTQGTPLAIDAALNIRNAEIGSTDVTGVYEVELSYYATQNSVTQEMYDSMVAAGPANATFTFTLSDQGLITNIEADWS